MLKGAKVLMRNSQGPLPAKTKFIADIQLAARGPLVNIGKDARKFPNAAYWVEPSTLTLSGLRPFRQPLKSSEVSKMIKEALKNPDDHVNNITNEGVQMLGLNDLAFVGRLANDFGIVISRDLHSVPCHYLTPPDLEYASGQRSAIGDTPTIRDASWQLTELKLSNDTSSTEVVILNLNELRDSKSNYVGSTELSTWFRYTLEDALHRHGMQSTVREPIAPAEENLTDPLAPDVVQQSLEDIALGTAADGSDAAVVVVLPKKDYDLYATIKRAADLRLGVLTTCAAADKVKHFLGPKAERYSNNLQHCANIALKLNLKSHGDNHTLSRSSIRELYGQPTPPGGLATADCDTIDIGADVTHPMGHRAPGCPSIAAVVGSVDNKFSQFPGSMRLQRSRKETITALQYMVKERLIDWADRHGGRLPGCMLFYRDGVSESQFDTVRKEEISLLQEAYDIADYYLQNRHQMDADAARKAGKAFYGGGEATDSSLVVSAADARSEEVLPESDGGKVSTKIPRPGKQSRASVQFKLIFVVIGKRHNTRLSPEKGGNSRPKGNVRPGLVVDQDITHAYVQDFYLQSHLPNRGTGRPAHYYVLTNGMGLPLRRLQEIIHAFCYNYARATKGVSYCAPAYYADRLCDRGRAYIRDWLQGVDGHESGLDPDKYLSNDAWKDAVAKHLHDLDYYRPHKNLTKYGDFRQNPWHPNMDRIMFYL